MMAEEAHAENAAQQTGERAVKNTVVRAVGEIIGKLASLVLFVALARSVGQSGLGVFVFAFAYGQIVMIPIELGFDRYMLRAVAKDRQTIHTLFFNVVAIKAILAIPVVALSLVLLAVLGYSAQTRETVYVLTAGLLIDVGARTVFSVFTAIERNELVAIGVVVQRVSAAALGLAALAIGYGVVAVAACYSIGAGLGLIVAAFLLARSTGVPRRSITRRAWPSLAMTSIPFAVQDVFTVMLFKLDAVILSLIATQAAVGRYGAAYRLFESSFFITVSLAGAFAAMYTYLSRDTQPSLQAVFGRSIKLALVLLVPIAVTFGVLGVPLSRAFFGATFERAADPLRVLAPAVILLGLITLGTSLIVSRRSPKPMVWVTALMVALNVALNVVLIPDYADTGAAIAMLATEAVFALVMLVFVVREVGRLRWVSMVTSPLVAGAAMAAAIGVLPTALIPAALVGGVAYIVVFVALERVISPIDLVFMTNLVRRWLPGRAAS
jgi:O-antigen/teichoic acid export membrane protein